MTEYDEFDFSGSQGATVAEASNKGGDFQREIEFLKLDATQPGIQQNKHRAIIRMVTESEIKPWMQQQGGNTTKYNFAWITVPQHFGPTKQKPPYAKEDARWPDKWSAVCRRGPVFTAKYNGDCYLCQNKVKISERTWALAIEREQVIENGQVIGYRDMTREVFDHDANGDPIVISTDAEGKKTYQKKTVPAWLVLNFGWKNFFNALNGQASWHKTVLDRDYVVTRSGMEGKDTSYSFVALDPIILPADNNIGLPGGTKYDLGLIVAEDNGRPIPLMEAMYPDMPDLRKIVAERTTDDYFGRWFVPGWLPKDFDPTKVQGQQQQVVSGYQPVGGQPGVQQGYVPPGNQQVQPQQPTQAPVQPQPEQAAAPAASVLEGLKSRVLAGSGAAQPQTDQPPTQ